MTMYHTTYSGNNFPFWRSAQISDGEAVPSILLVACFYNSLHQISSISSGNSVYAYRLIAPNVNPCLA